MDIALKQYQTRQQKKIWGEETTEHKELLNLTAQLMSSKKEINELKRKIVPKKQIMMKNNKTKPKWDKSKTTKKFFKPRDPKEAETYRKERYDKAPQWMKQKPNDNKSSKEHDGKKYFWCQYHKLWQMHKSEDCRLRDKVQNSTSPTQSENPKLKLQDKMNLVATQDDDDEYDL